MAISFETVQDHTLLLDLLEKVDVYPLTNAKVLALVLQFVERYSDEESNPYLKKLHFWKSVQSYPSVVEEYALDKKKILTTGTMKVISILISSPRVMKISMIGRSGKATLKEDHAF